jgi:hypothetical protein
MRGNLAPGQPVRVQRQHDLVDIGQPPLSFLDDLRLERAFPIPWHVDDDLAGGIGDHRLDRDPLRMFVDSRPGSARRFGCPRYSVSSSLSAVSSTFLVNSFNSPFGQLQPASLGLGHHRRRGGLLGRQLPARLVVTLAWTHRVRCHHSQCPSRRASARRRAENTVRYTGPRHPQGPFRRPVLPATRLSPSEARRLEFVQEGQ